MKFPHQEPSRPRFASASQGLESRAPLAGARTAICARPSTLDPRPHGFTLIELILVLTLLAIATSLVAPSLSAFFRGRALDSEARQLLSLIHAGQSRAVSEGFPMLLWIDSPGRAYGLEEEAAPRSRNAPDADPKAEEFTFTEPLRIDAVNAAPLPVNGRNLPAIRFLSDGTIDEVSAAAVRIAAANGESLWLIQATNRLSYEIRASDR